MSAFRRVLYTSLVLAVLLIETLGGGRTYPASADARPTANPAPPAPPAPPQPPQLPAPDPSSPFGVAGVMRWPDWGSFSQPIDAFAQAGAAWVREDFAWGLIQPTEQRFDWTATDRIVGALADHKANVLGIIAYSANWATPSKDDDNQPSPISFYPPDTTRYAAFVRTLVARYKGSIHYWEVWNEPDNGMFWKPAPDAKQYAEVLKAAYSAIKGADPSAKVLSAGVSGNAVPYLEQLVAAGAGNSFDILALHPYAVPLNPAQGRVESRPEVHKLVDVELTKYRAFLERHGYNRPIWVTEIGWPANSWGLDAQAQADYLAQAYAQMLASGLAERIFWYSFKDESAQASDTWGLLAWGNSKTDLSQRRPAFNAYATSAHMLTGAKGAGRIALGSFSIVEDFEKAGSWTRSLNTAGTMQVAAMQAHSGQSAGKLDYNFTGPSQAVDFAPPTPLNLPGKPTRLGLWVRGDSSGDYLSAWLKDRDGELFKLRLGAVSGAGDGWRYYESRMNNYFFDWEHTGGSPSNGAPDYPLQFVGFRLENTPDEPVGSGTIYVDDLQSYDGPDASAVRFTRPDGQVVDVLWSVDPVTVQLATRSSTSQQTDRDGNTTSITAKDGALTLHVSSSPIYIVHKPGDPPAPTVPTGGGVSEVHVAPPAPTATATPTHAPPSPMCLAAVKTSALPDADNSFFVESGHNLRGVFQQYWETHGALSVLGYPITEEFTAASTDGKEYRQQYFERARLEYHPENSPPNDVQVGLLGAWTTIGRTFQPGAPGPATGSFFPQTGHGLALFKEWWAEHGGLGVLGYPISEEIQEKNAADGKLYTVQYFERNRLEYHPENANTPNAVLLGLLGDEYLGKQGCK